MSYTTGKLEYFAPPEDGTRPFTNINHLSEKNWVENTKQMQIENLRGKEDSVSLDTAGFQLYRRAAKHTTFTDDAQIKKEYYPESIDLIKELTGASRVVLFDHS
jgi:hypothetical protein